MSDEHTTNDDRRTVLKTLAATGLAGAGIAGASGSGAAQSQGQAQAQPSASTEVAPNDCWPLDVELTGTFDTGEYEENVPTGFSPGEDATFEGKLGLYTVRLTDDDELVAIGRLRGTLSGSTTQQITEQFEVVLGPLENALTILSPDSTGRCPILRLLIGPIFLDLLGLRLTTETLDINLSRIYNGGSLFGNLLCAVASLHDQ